MDFIWVWFFFFSWWWVCLFFIKDTNWPVLKTAKIQSTVQVALFWYLFISGCTRTMRASHLQNHASVHSGGSFWRLHIPDYVYNSENLNKYIFPHLPNLINMNYCPFLKNPEKWIYQVPVFYFSCRLVHRSWQKKFFLTGGGEGGEDGLMDLRNCFEMISLYNDSIP